MRKAGQRFGTASLMVFDQDTCLVGATLSLMEFFARESCGWCTPCREGIPFVRELLRRLEAGEGTEEHIGMLQEMLPVLDLAYCAFAPGAAEPLRGLLTHFMDEVRAHVTEKRCPFGNPPPHVRGKACGTRPPQFGPTPCPEDQCPI
jgi:NADH-quinone oxidoreductase subunit F